MTQTTLASWPTRRRSRHAVRIPRPGGRTAGGIAFDDEGSGEPVVLAACRRRGPPDVGADRARARGPPSGDPARRPRVRRVPAADRVRGPHHGDLLALLDELADHPGPPRRRLDGGRDRGRGRARATRRGRLARARGAGRGALRRGAAGAADRSGPRRSTPSTAATSTRRSRSTSGPGSTARLRPPDAVDPAVRAFVGQMQREAFELPEWDDEQAPEHELTPPAAGRLRRAALPGARRGRRRRSAGRPRDGGPDRGGGAGRSPRRVRPTPRHMLPLERPDAFADVVERVPRRGRGPAVVIEGERRAAQRRRLRVRRPRRQLHDRDGDPGRRRALAGPARRVARAPAANARARRQPRRQRLHVRRRDPRRAARRSMGSARSSCRCSSASTTSSRASRRAIPRERRRRSSTTLLARLPPDRIVTVATPDYTVTPQGADYGDPATQAAGIRREQRDARGTWPPSAASPSSTSTTCRCSRPRTGASSPTTGSTRPERSTRSGSSGSGRSSRGCWAVPARAALAGAVSAGGVELLEPLVVDPEVVGDLVEQRLLDRPRQSLGSRVRPRQRTAEERDLARERDVVHAEPGPRHALVEPEQAARADRGELIGRRPRPRRRSRPSPAAPANASGRRSRTSSMTASKSTSSGGGDGSTGRTIPAGDGEHRGRAPRVAGSPEPWSCR